MEEVLVLLLLPFLNTYNIEAAPTYLYHYCYENGTYASNGPYEKNLFKTLSSIVTTDTTNATTGQATIDIAFGQYLCRGDVSTSICYGCANTAQEEIMKRCPNMRAAAIWYDECMMYYSGSYKFGSVQISGGVIMYNTTNETAPNQFNVTVRNQFSKLVMETLNKVISIAATSENEKKFAVEKANFTGFCTLCTLAQCLPD